MSGEVALRLLLKGQREMAAGVGQITREVGELGKVSDKAAGSAKRMSLGLDGIEKSGVQATASSKALLVATNKVADAQQAAAAASTKAAKARLVAADALAEATAKQAAGDLEGAKAAKANADALTRQATAANRSAIAMRASAGAARDQVTAIKATTTALEMQSRASGGRTGRGVAFGAAAKTGGILAKTGLAVGAYAGYEGVKRDASLQTSITQLGTLANVPKSQLGALQSFAINASPGLRETPGTIASQIYRIASASPGKPYSLSQLESLTKGAAGLSVLAGSSADPAQVARVFGIIRANGGLGTKNPSQIAAIAAATIGSGDMTGGDLISALGTGGLAVNAARHKLSFLQLGGILAQEGDLGVNGSRAGNSLQHAISLLASPNKQAAGIYSSLGLTPTTVDQVMRTQGLTAGVAMLKSALNSGIKSGALGTAATRADFEAQGFNAKQAAKMAGQGNASLQDLALTRLFGGAKQSVPIISIFDALTRTNSKTAEIARNSTAGVYNAHLSAAKSTPAMQWQNFDLGVQKVENDLGLHLIPILESTANWLGKNKTEVKDFATVIGVLAIPALAAWGASLAMKGVTNVTNFTNALRGQNKELATTGGIAQGQVGGINKMGAAVMGVTAAIGVWELGKATSSHGAGGAAVAGLGGAVTGMIVGFQIGGPWGAAIGAAGGALVGLAGHFFGAAKGASAATKATQAYETQLLSLNSGKGGAGSRRASALSVAKQAVDANPALAAEMARYGVTASQIVSVGLGGPMTPQLKAFLAAGDLASVHPTVLSGTRAGPYMKTLPLSASAQALVANNSALVELENAIAASIAQSINAGLATGSLPGSSAGLGPPRRIIHSSGSKRSSGAGSATSGEHDNVIRIHNHLYIDGKEVQTTVHKNDTDQLARR